MVILLRDSPAEMAPDQIPPSTKQQPTARLSVLPGSAIMLRPVPAKAGELTSFDHQTADMSMSISFWRTLHLLDAYLLVPSAEEQHSSLHDMFLFINGVWMTGHAMLLGHTQQWGITHGGHAGLRITEPLSARQRGFTGRRREALC